MSTHYICDKCGKTTLDKREISAVRLTTFEAVDYNFPDLCKNCVELVKQFIKQKNVKMEKR
jgi:hypothetical protein